MAGRLHSAHMNATEAFAPFAAAVILAHLRGVPALEFAKLCLLFLALRLAYQLFYAINLPTLRFAHSHTLCLHTRLTFSFAMQIVCLDRWLPHRCCFVCSCLIPRWS
jgi:uncharacterized MAPEG superfamily protein